MFTGIITDIGQIKDIQQLKGKDTRLVIQTRYPVADIALGASIACAGVCLTVVEKGEDDFSVDVSAETLRCTTLGAMAKGDRLNLERALRMGDELGGHMVSGHVDGVAVVKNIEATKGDSHTITLEVPKSLAHYIAAKGSVTLDGVSLTVNMVKDNAFMVNIIPHTWQETTLQYWEEGTEVNVEVDIIARYMERMMQEKK